jgi:hypothetical protein
MIPLARVLWLLIKHISPRVSKCGTLKARCVHRKFLARFIVIVCSLVHLNPQLGSRECAAQDIDLKSELNFQSYCEHPTSFNVISESLTSDFEF